MALSLKSALFCRVLLCSLCPRESLQGEGGTPLPPNTSALTPPQRHSHTPTPAPTAFPTVSNRPPTASRPL